VEIKKKLLSLSGIKNIFYDETALLVLKFIAKLKPFSLTNVVAETNL